VAKARKINDAKYTRVSGIGNERRTRNTLEWSVENSQIQESGELDLQRKRAPALLAGLTGAGPKSFNEMISHVIPTQANEGLTADIFKQEVS